MKKKLIIMIGCSFLAEDEEIIKNSYFRSKNSVSNAQFEKKIIDGFISTQEQTDDFIFVSAPSVGNWPFSCRKLFVSRMHESNYLKSVSYCTIYGFCNFFKSISIKIKLKKILSKKMQRQNDFEIHVIACEAHKPYLDAVAYIKKRFNKAFSTLIVPDMPSDMIRSKNPLYLLLKRNNVKSIYKLCDSFIDSYVCLTAFINNKINKGKKPFLICEGVTSGAENCNLKNNYSRTNENKVIRCVFIGKTDKRNGIDLLIKAANIAPKGFLFDIYGSGDFCKSAVNSNNKNIVFHGYVSPSQIDGILKKADVLVSPRLPNEDYTKYSFPSKLFDYISSYKPIVTYKLPCYFKELDQILFYPSDLSAESLCAAVVNASTAKIDRNKYKKIIENYSSTRIALKIKSLFDLKR